MRTLTERAKEVVRTARREFHRLTGRELHVPIEARPRRAHLGSSYGGWWVALEGLGPSSVVYGVGVGQDISWDLAMIERFGCAVQAFDPTPRCLRWIQQQRLPAEFSFHPWGMASYDGEATFTIPNTNPAWTSYSMSGSGAGAADVVKLQVRRLSTIMRELGHERIDVLKMDIEGAEYDVLTDLLAGDIRPRQLLVEYHYSEDWRKDVPRTAASVAALRRAGYKLFARSAHGPEFSFVLG